jgi:hypothetical protein
MKSSGRQPELARADSIAACANVPLFVHCNIFIAMHQKLRYKVYIARQCMMGVSAWRLPKSQGRFAEG